MFAVASVQGMWVATGRRTDDDIELVAPAIIALMNFILIKSVLSQQENHALVFVILALVVALIWRAKQNERVFAGKPQHGLSTVFTGGKTRRYRAGTM